MKLSLALILLLPLFGGVVNALVGRMLPRRVVEALEALITWFKRVGQGREQQTPRLSDRAQRVFVEVREICQWRMGMVSLSPNLGKLEEGSRICTADEIVACLKKILKSVTRWNREYGRQGYLNFAGRFIE